MDHAISFVSKVQELAKLEIPSFNEMEVEPMMFSADAHFAYENAGPITRGFLDALPADWKSENFIFDSRVNMLMPGWFPCIPGWHLDDVPRSREDGQPNHLDPEYHAEHILCCLGDASLTEFALGDCSLVEPDLGKIVYGEWHKEIENQISCGNLHRDSAKSGQMYWFNWQTWHRGTAATKSGWRWFGRITRFSQRSTMNKIRKQTQVYMSATEAGW